MEIQSRPSIRQTHGMMRAGSNRPVLLALVLAVLLLASLACSLGGVSVGKNSVTVEITLKQDQINSLLKNLTSLEAASTNGDTTYQDIIKSVSGIEMHNGFVRVLIKTQDADGKDISGSFDVNVTAADDVLQVKIINVNLPGVDVNEAGIEDLNKTMTAALTQSVYETNGAVLFKEAAVTEGGLKLKIQVNFITPTPAG